LFTIAIPPFAGEHYTWAVTESELSEAGCARAPLDYGKNMVVYEQ
jgi:hypothetical protein